MFWSCFFKNFLVINNKNVGTNQPFPLDFHKLFFCLYLTVSVELIILSLFFGLGDISGRVFTSSRCVNAIFTVISFYLSFKPWISNWWSVLNNQILKPFNHNWKMFISSSFFRATRGELKIKFTCICTRTSPTSPGLLL